MDKKDGRERIQRDRQEAENGKSEREAKRVGEGNATVIRRFLRIKFSARREF